MIPISSAAFRNSKLKKSTKNLQNATLAEIEERYADRIPKTATRAALAEDTSKSPRYKSVSEMLKVLKA
jgi:hypothetical protein